MVYTIVFGLLITIVIAGAVLAIYETGRYMGE